MTLKQWYIPCALAIPVSYVGSLYLFDGGDEHTDHPSTIKKRVLGVFLSTTTTVAGTYYLLKHEFSDPFKVMGLFWDSNTAIMSAQAVGMCAMMYLGTLAMDVYDYGISWLFWPSQWKKWLTDLTWWRNTVIAPITEELAFRSCLTILVKYSLGDNIALYGSPILFSLSHFHHLYNDINHSRHTNRFEAFKEALLQRSFQALYTYIFGLYATAISLKAKNVVPAVLSHSFCNSLGLPRVSDVDNYRKRDQVIFYGVHFIGLGLFIYQLSRFGHS